MSEKKPDNDTAPRRAPPQPAQPPARPQSDEGAKPKPQRPDPTRYGDWEKNGRCIDF